MATKRWFCFITMVAVAVLLLSACKSKKSRISSDGEQKDSVGVVYDDTVIYVKDHDTAYRDGFVLYPQPIYDRYVMQIRLFDTTTRTDIPYCFRPECEHKPPTYDENGQPIGEVCTSYNLSNNTCFLLGESIYSFNFPCLYRFDRRGENVKTICELDMPQPIIWQTVYSKTDMYLFFYYDCEYEQTIDSGGHTIWLPGKRREDHITGILHVSLVDGSYEDITPKSDCKYRDVLNFRVEDAGLFFYYCDTDEDEMVTLDMGTDSERYAYMSTEERFYMVYLLRLQEVEPPEYRSLTEKFDRELTEEITRYGMKDSLSSKANAYDKISEYVNYLETQPGAVATESKGYELLYKDRRQNVILGTGAMLLVIMCSILIYFREFRSGMNDLIRVSYSGWGRVNRCKLTLLFLTVLFLFACIFGRYMYLVLKGFGAPNIECQANSLMDWAKTSAFVSIGDKLLLIYLKRFLGMLITSGIAILIVCRARSFILSSVICLMVLVVPLLLCLTDVSAVEWIALNWFFV